MPPICGEQIVRLPSLTGTDARELDEYLPPLPTREQAVRQVEEALGEIVVSRDPVVLLLVAEWGEGKTSIFHAVIEPWLREKGWFAAQIATSMLLEHLSYVERRFSDRSPAHRLVAAILSAINEKYGVGVKLNTQSTARKYVVESLASIYSRYKGLVVFIDEFEDIVMVGKNDRVAEIIAGILGLLNGDVREVSALCLQDSGTVCYAGKFHVVLALTPPAYSKLMAFRDFSTIAARLKRRVRSVRVRQLTRRESILFVHAVAKYSLGEDGIRGLLADPRYINALVSSGMGNMGAIVSAYRYLAGYAVKLGETICKGKPKLLEPDEIVSALSTLKLSIGGAEIPAINYELYSRLVEASKARAKLAGIDPHLAEKLVQELVVAGYAVDEEVAAKLGVERRYVEALVEELNVMAEQGWVRSELGARKLVYRVYVTKDIDKALYIARQLAPEVSKLLPHLTRNSELDEHPLIQIVDSLVFVDSTGTPILAVPRRSDLVDLIRDVSPVELSEAEAERLATIVGDKLFGALKCEGEALLLSPRVLRAVYVSPELQYLDFIRDRMERFNINRRTYTHARPAHLVIALTSLIAYGARVEEFVVQGENTVRLKLVLDLPSKPQIRVLLTASTGSITLGEVERIESQIATAVLSKWHPHAVMVAYYGTIEADARRKLEEIEKKYLTKVVTIAIPTMVARTQLLALGLKILETSKTMEEAVYNAIELVRGQELAEKLGFDHYRLTSTLSELQEQMAPIQRLVSALEEGIEGVPLILRDPKLAFDVEKPTELSGALRYYLVVPAPKATPKQALAAAHEYVMRYHIFRHAGEGRGILSPDIDRREVVTLERYTNLLAVNKMIERTNGEYRIDVLSPQEKLLLKILEYLGAKHEPVPLSQVWDLAVNVAQNPGTKKMVVQALAYRGLIDTTSTRRIDDKTKVRLISKEEIVELLEKLRRELADLEADIDTINWGYIVAAKARDYRVGTSKGFVEKMRSLLSVAEEAYRAGNLLMAARLVRIVRDALHYYREDIIENHVKPVVKIVRETKKKLYSALEQLRELREELETVINEYVVAGKVEVALPILEAIQQLLNRISEVESLEFDEKELEDRVAQMWREASKKAPREPGRELPFYIGGLGPRLHFNYKLWLIVDHAKKLGFDVKLENEQLIVVDIEKVVEKVVKVIDTVRSKVEEFTTLLAKVEKLAKTLAERYGLTVGVVSRGFARIKASGKMSLDDVVQLVERWRSEVENSERMLWRLEDKLDNLLKRLETIYVVEKEVKALLKQAHDLLSEVEILGLISDAEALKAAIDFAMDSLRESENLLKRVGELINSGDYEGIEKGLDIVESSLVMLRDSKSKLENTVRSCIVAVQREVERLRVEYNALASILGEKVDATPLSLHELVRGVEKFRRKVVETGILGETELKVYLTLIELKRVRGEMLLSEAAKNVAEKLGVGVREAKRCLLKLIEKGIVEPKI